MFDQLDSIRIPRLEQKLPTEALTHHLPSATVLLALANRGITPKEFAEEFPMLNAPKETIKLVFQFIKNGSFLLPDEQSEVYWFLRALLYHIVLNSLQQDDKYWGMHEVLNRFTTLGERLHTKEPGRISTCTISPDVVRTVMQFLAAKDIEALLNSGNPLRDELDVFGIKTPTPDTHIPLPISRSHLRLTVEGEILWEDAFGNKTDIELNPVHYYGKTQVKTAEVMQPIDWWFVLPDYITRLLANYIQRGDLLYVGNDLIQFDDHYGYTAGEYLIICLQVLESICIAHPPRGRTPEGRVGDLSVSSVCKEYVKRCRRLPR